MISVIICSIDKTRFEKIFKNYAELLKEGSFEIIGIHDAKSLCEGYNRGIKKSSGSILIFSHDDIEILSADFKEKIKQHLLNYDVVGVAGTSCLISGRWDASGQPYMQGVITTIDPESRLYTINVYGADSITIPKIHALDGLFVAVKRNVVEEIQFDADTFDGFHLYDMDFTFSAYLSGFKLAVCSDIAIIHESLGGYNKKWEQYNELFLHKHNGKLASTPPGPRRIACIRASTKQAVVSWYKPEKLSYMSAKLKGRAS